MRHIGLALGGGGARGFAHLGAMIALESAKVPISSIAGSSMGAAMGAVKAIGGDLRMTAAVVRCLDLKSLLPVGGSPVRELQRFVGRSMVEYVRGSSWREDEAAPDVARLSELFSLLTARKTFDDVRIPFCAVAADLETGERVEIRSGRLATAAAASAAVPGVFSPVPWEGRYLIDGGTVDKLPIDVVIDMGAQAVVAIDTGAPLTRGIETCLDVLLQSQRITSHHLTRLQTTQARERVNGRVLVLRPEVGSIRMLDFDRVDEAIQAGIVCANARLDEIRVLLAD